MASIDMFNGMFKRPEEIRAARLDELIKNRQAISNMGGSMSQLLGQVAAGGGATGSMMAEAAAGMFGLKTQEEAKAARVNDIMSNVMWDDDKSVASAVSQFVRMGEPEAALRIKEYADQKRNETMAYETNKLTKDRLVGTIADEQTAREEAKRIKAAEANLAKVYRTADPKTSEGRKLIQDAIAQVDTLKAIQTGINWQNQDFAAARNTREAAAQAHRISMDMNADERSGTLAQLNNELTQLNIDAKKREADMPMFKTISVLVKEPVTGWDGQPVPGQFKNVSKQVSVVLNERGEYSIPGGITQELQAQLGLTAPVATTTTTAGKDEPAARIPVAAGSDPSLQAKTVTPDELAIPAVASEVKRQQDVTQRLTNTIDDFVDPAMGQVAAATYKQFGTRQPQFDNPQWVAMVKRFFPTVYKKYVDRGLIK